MPGPIRTRDTRLAEAGHFNDARREFVGSAAERSWLAKEMVGDDVQLDVRDVPEHHGDIIMRGGMRRHLR